MKVIMRHRAYTNVVAMDTAFFMMIMDFTYY